MVEGIEIEVLQTNDHPFTIRPPARPGASLFKPTVMTKKISNSFWRRWWPVALVAAIAVILLVVVLRNPGEKKLPEASKPGHSGQEGDSLFSWNILFRENTTPRDREKALIAVRNYLVEYYQVHRPDITLHFDNPVVCPCDSTLFNLNFKSLDGSGQSASSIPPQPPGGGGSGSMANVLYVATNIKIKELEPSQDTLPSTLAGRFPLESKPVNNGALLAVIDTGIDTALFHPGIRQLLWQPASGNPIYNVLPNANVKDMYDDHKGKHGSAVTALAISNIERNVAYAKIMVLKALDSAKQGSTYTFSCALSYAIRNQAQVINASLGYYGNTDSILRHYLLKAGDRKSCLVFVAAGNDPGPRLSSKYCDHSVVPGNLISLSHPFYPAVASAEMDHVITVTGLNDLYQPCYYQNYSSRFVTLGVVGRRYCCAFFVPFLNNFYEGSSFSTPVASGAMMSCLIRNNLVMSAANDDWYAHYVKRASTNYTVRKQYINPIYEYVRQ